MDVPLAPVTASTFSGGEQCLREGELRRAQRDRRETQRRQYEGGRGLKGIELRRLAQAIHTSAKSTSPAELAAETIDSKRLGFPRPVRQRVAARAALRERLRTAVVGVALGQLDVLGAARAQGERRGGKRDGQQSASHRARDPKGLIVG